ncbi:MAG: NgoFVII family restriction endonuclease [Clostridia bacterium]|nr:NgoFVII family restriction endonuclease [Clostridia bacterium]
MKKGNNQFDENALSIFDLEDDNGVRISNSNKLDVVKFDYLGAESLTWQELFSGFDHLHAITFSSGVNFIYNLLSLFKTADVIFGCEGIMSYSLHEIIAYQNKLIERIRTAQSKSKTDLLSKIDSGCVHFSAARNQLSHEKLYLLSSDDGRKRVVMGSANMSFNAFSGIQRENISYTDSEKAFEWYFDVFNSLKESSADDISRKALEISDLGDNIDELPVSQTIKAKRVLSIEPTHDNDEEIKFILDVQKTAERLKPLMPAKGKTEKYLISPDEIIKVRKHIQAEEIREREIRKEYPQLHIDVENQCAVLNEELLDLNPSSIDIKNDVDWFLQYMDGYKNFHGDPRGMQYRYYEFANWFFCSPFMAIMRDTAIRYDQQKLPYPIFGLLYGQSKAGKTSFLETLLKMMIGQKPKVSAPDFTRSSIDDLRFRVQGAPIIVDDLTNARFKQHAVETIKNDEFGYADHLTNYSAVVISANEDVKAVSQEVIRRTVICRVEAGLTNTEVMQSNIVRKVQSKIGTAFYREYLRRMIPEVEILLETMKDDDADSAPDILKKSSEIFVEMISEFGSEKPEYIRVLSLEDYFGEAVTGKNAKKTIQRAWKTSKKEFVVNEKTNELRYNIGNTFDADRLLKELPETLEGRKSREWVVMNLAEARKFFELDFKVSLLDKIKNK